MNQGFPPEQTDGNARHNGALAKELAKNGHNVFVVSKSNVEYNTIHFINGAWVYRHVTKRFEYETTGYGRVDNQLAYARSVLETVRKINDKKKIDFILVPIWDVEGLAILTHKVAPTILSLMSPLKKVVETQWFNSEDPSYEITYAFERYCVLHADAVMPISENIKETIGELYDVDWDDVEAKVPVKTIPLGVDSQFIIDDKSLNEWYKAKKATDKIKVLYVGRFERRKGIDLLLDVMPKILKSRSNIEFELIGDNSGLDENGVSYLDEFKKHYSKEPWFKQIKLKGYVTDEELAAAYRNCDIFVAPSRYESFGQIYIEAMASGKPVIGTDVGGIPEIVKHEKNGYLIKNESSKELEKYLLELINDKVLREKMGRKSADILRQDYASDIWADRFISFAKQSFGL